MSATITRRFDVCLKANHPLRNRIADLSSGDLYDTPLEWYYELNVRVGEEFLVVAPLDGGVFSMPLDSDCPRFYLPLYGPAMREEGAIWVTIHRHITGRYEIVCGVC